ncbi:MAG: Fis family transcriptional regulator [Gammaproteobacteria bacterium]
MKAELPSLAGMTPAETTPRALHEHVADGVSRYFKALDGEQPSEVYNLFLAELERPLLNGVLDYTRGNQSKAAILLGISRSTLRKKLALHGID